MERRRRIDEGRPIEFFEGPVQIKLNYYGDNNQDNTDGYRTPYQE